MATIAQRIQEGLNINNMVQADLVRLTGIGKSSISTYLSGEYEPKQKNLYKIAKALNVNEAWLMGYDVPRERTTTSLLETESKSFTDYEIKLVEKYRQLNQEGQEKAVEYIDDLCASGKYKKRGEAELDNKSSDKSIG